MNNEAPESLADVREIGGRFDGAHDTLLRVTLQCSVFQYRRQYLVGKGEESLTVLVSLYVSFASLHLMRDEPPDLVQRVRGGLQPVPSFNDLLECVLI